MAMTEEERRRARNEASKRWYQAHKAAKAAMNRLPKAKAAEAKKPAAGAKLEKAVDKFVDKGAKAAETYRGLVKSAAALLADVYRSGDEKLVANAVKAFGRRLSLEVEADPATGWGVVRSGDLGESKFRVPKAKPAPEEARGAVEDGPCVSDPDTADDRVVPVDPSILTGVGEDEVLKSSDVDSQPGYRDDDFDDEDDDFDDEDDEDFDDEDDDERAERRRRREEDDWAEGHDDMMREMSEQGAFDDYEN